MVAIVVGYVTNWTINHQHPFHNFKVIRKNSTLMK